MVLLKYDLEVLGYMNYFARVTKLNPKDCFLSGESIIFVAPEGKAGLAIGKNGQNVIVLKDKLRKQIKIVEFSNAAEKLIENYVFPVKPISVNLLERDGKRIVEIRFKYPRDRQTLLANTQTKLKQLKTIVSRYHPEIEDLRVLQ
ncbi:MAG: NusA-like transcription termination signal-binding factor [DPANN group archaeon]|nr:NusA-like transcription termination signal-binding factor [DPANN group archaeon]